jgi:hypothetical protein
VPALQLKACSMAAAQQPAAPVQLVPVHDEPGAVKFQYTSFGAIGGGFVLGGGGGGGSAAAAPLLAVAVERQQLAAPAAAQQAPALEEYLEDFISLAPPAPAAEPKVRRPCARGETPGVQAVLPASNASSRLCCHTDWLPNCCSLLLQPQRPEPNGGMAGSLLDDYVALGILEDPAAAAAKKVAAAAAAAAASSSSRPEELKVVPWLGALKGIRSPLMRLHQGAPGSAGGNGRLWGPRWAQRACGAVNRPLIPALPA